MIRVTACAKVNLYLEIVGKRPDGYHTLETVFQTISLGDQLLISPASELTLTCTDPTLPVDDQNLVMNAAMQLRTALKEPRGAKIHLDKQVPMGAGLGGGSSDAAAVLKSLLKLWERKIGKTELHRLAAGLGADVPFFLEGGLCAATGIGEQLRPIKSLARTWLVLVYPGFGVSTKDAYSKVKLPFARPAPSRSADPRENLFNRFEELVFPDRPKLPQLKQALLDAGASAALMSGSGSSVFGLVKSRAEGVHVLSRIQARYPQSWLVHTI